MSDRARRASARAGGATPEDEAQRLREGLRAGQLAVHWVELAAYVGDPAACAALTRPAGDTPEWAHLWAWEREVAVRACLALARHLEGVWRAESPFDPDGLREVLEGLEAWIAPAHERAPGWTDDAQLRARLEVAAEAALLAAFGRRTAERTGELSPLGLSALVVGRASVVATGDDDTARAALQTCLQSAAVVLGRPAVEALVRAELAPFALRRAAE